MREMLDIYCIQVAVRYILLTLLQEYRIDTILSWCFKRGHGSKGPLYAVFSDYALDFLSINLIDLVVSASAINCLERLVSEMSYYVSSETLNPALFLTIKFTALLQAAVCSMLTGTVLTCTGVRV